MGEDMQVSARVPDDPVAPRMTGGIPVRGTAIVGVGLLISQLVAMLQMLIVSRLLGPEQFGVFGAMAVILLLGSTTMAATQMVIARHVASGRAGHHVGAAAVLAAGTVTTGIAMLLSPLLSSLLHLSDVTGLLLVAAAFIPLTITGAQFGLLQGHERHVRLGALYVVASVARVAGAVIGAAAGGTADSTALGLLVGTCVGALAGQLPAGPPAPLGLRRRARASSSWRWAMRRTPSSPCTP